MSNRGGKRENAGRPAGQGKYCKLTVTMRIPQSQTAMQKCKRANAAGENGITEIEVDEFLNDQPTLLPLFATKESVSLYISRAAEKLRRQQSYAGAVHVSIRTSSFNEKEPYYANSMTIALPRQTDDTRLLTRVALWGLRRIYRTGYISQSWRDAVRTGIPAIPANRSLRVNEH